MEVAQGGGGCSLTRRSLALTQGVHGDLYDKQGSHKSATHRGPEGMHLWRARSTTRPRQPLHKGPREPETCNGKESELEKTTKNEGGRGVRANACGGRAGGCSLSV